MLISVSLSSNPVTDCCLTIKARSPLAPLKKGGTRVFSKSLFLMDYLASCFGVYAGDIAGDKSLFKVPLFKGDLGGSRQEMKTIFIKSFRLNLTLLGFLECLYYRDFLLKLRTLKTRCQLSTVNCQLFNHVSKFFHGRF